MTRVVIQILLKLERALNRSMVRVFQKGGALAEGISALAVAWGNELSHNWRFDLEFQLALGTGVTNLS